MKILLIGYPGSQKVVPASKYLVNKYLKGFDVYWQNYTGEINGWSKYVANCLKNITDEQVILALDDYLIAGTLQLLDINLAQAVCAKLCFCTEQENEEYPVTTQYTLWNRTYLIGLLEKTTTPWDFEITGSDIFKQENKQMIHRPVLKYNVHSALSKRWEGIDLKGLNEEDVKEVQKCI